MYLYLIGKTYQITKIGKNPIHDASVAWINKRLTLEIHFSYAISLIISSYKNATPYSLLASVSVTSLLHKAKWQYFQTSTHKSSSSQFPVPLRQATNGQAALLVLLFFIVSVAAGIGPS